MYTEHLKNLNQKSAKAAEERVINAYNEWVITKTHIKRTAIKFNTDPGKLTRYIISKGHSLSSFDYNIFEDVSTEEQAYWLGLL